MHIQYCEMEFWALLQKLAAKRYVCYNKTKDLHPLSH